MKLRNAYKVTDLSGYTWWGNCPVWAALNRKAGCKVESARVMGTGKWSCPSCEHSLGH